MIIAMWIARQPLRKPEMIQAKVKAAGHANALRAKHADARKIAAELFPTDPLDLLLRKAAALVRLWNASGLNEDVRDSAYCHAASRCELNEDSLRLMEQYVNRVIGAKPRRDVFDGAEYDSWRPNLVPAATPAT